MNFENYNNIYKEILDDETGDLSANYLLNKYEIKHEEELLNILNQIKKNEYISSDNKIINRLIKELDEDDNLLDINEIINIKDKVININDFDLQEEEVEEKSNIKADEIIKDKSEKSKDIINETTNNKNYLLYAVPVVLLALTLFIFNSSSEEKTEEISIVKNEKVVKLEEKPKKVLKEEPLIETTKEFEDIVIKITENDIKEEIEKLDVKKDAENIIDSTSNSEIKLNKIVDAPKEVLHDEKSTINLKSLNEIAKYVKKLKVEDDKLLFEGNYYSEKSNLFGYKIFKITPLYVKFEDVNKNIRKRFLINK